MAYNLKKFQTDAEYSAATLNYPAVSWVVSGDTIHFDKTEPTPPTFQGKWLATYTGGTTASAECDSTSAITMGEIENSYDVESIEIGDCVTEIGVWLFDRCYNLTSVTFGNNVTTIGELAFDGSSLTSIDIPDSVTSIGNRAFTDCGGLASVTVNSTTPPTLGSDVFADTSIAYDEGYIYVPAESVNLYKEANGWSDYASNIVAIS